MHTANDLCPSIRPQGATSILVSASLMALAVRLLARKPPKDLPLSASAASFSSSSGSLAALASGVGGEAAWAQYRDAGARRGNEQLQLEKEQFSCVFFSD